MRGGPAATAPPRQTPHEGDTKMKLTKNDIKQKMAELDEVLLKIGGPTSRPSRSDVGASEV